MKAREIFEYNKLTWPEMNDAIEMGKVVLLPTGSTEQHGAHLPLDTDLFLVESVCRELGRRAPDKVLVSAAAIALIKDLPPMLLSVSRLMFAWAEDGIFPRAVAAVHPTFRTPHVAILASGVMATLGVVGSHLAGDFFLGVDILVTAMLVNFLLMAVTVLTLPRRNPSIARSIGVMRSSKWRATSITWSAACNTAART